MANAHGLKVDWTFESSPIVATRELRRWFRSRWGASGFPNWGVVRPPVPARRWICLFLYMPDGRVDAAQAFTLSKLKEVQEPVLVIAGTPDSTAIDPIIQQSADALIWKSLGGFDFSAYSLALHVLAATSSGTDVLVMNDSNFGPFSDLSACFDQAPWDLTGFTGSYLFENHIQSYAFVLKALTEQRLRLMGQIFPRTHAYDLMSDVVLLQELPMARVAARSMSVGARWFLPQHTGLIDPSLARPLELLELGHPFLKKSLFGKHARFADQSRLREELRRRGHPQTD